MSVFQIILYPFSLIYAGITGFRNLLYDLNIRKSVQFETNVISVGNMEVGGTGKTPMIDYLIEFFKDRYHIATLSRGYKRKTRGFKIIGDDDNASTAGDEPFQLFSKYKESITVAVSKERETAIPFILAEKPDTEIVLLDDAYQYRTVKPSLSILLSRYDRPFYTDLVMPAGRLRERRNNINRADVIVITKCPSKLNKKERERIKMKIADYDFKGKIFFTKINYENPLPIFHSMSFSNNVLLVSGIAHPESLEKYISNKYNLLGHVQFEDHHNYSSDDIEHIHDVYKKHSEKNDISVIMTEKDASKWRNMKIRDEAEFMPLFYLPIKTEFLHSEEDFQDILNNSIKEYRN